MRRVHLFPRHIVERKKVTGGVRQKWYNKRAVISKREPDGRRVMAFSMAFRVGNPEPVTWEKWGL